MVTRVGRAIRSVGGFIGIGGGGQTGVKGSRTAVETAERKATTERSVETAGQTAVSTTSGTVYVQSPSPSPSGGGGGSGGGGSGGGNGSGITATPTRTPTTTSTTPTRTSTGTTPRITQESLRGGGRDQFGRTQDYYTKFKEDITRRQLKKETIDILKGGGVRTRGVTYHGKTIVPDSGGKTATQIQAETLKEAKKEFGKDTIRGTYSATITIPTTATLDLEKNKQYVKDLVSRSGYSVFKDEKIKAIDKLKVNIQSKLKGISKEEAQERISYFRSEQDEKERIRKEQLAIERELSYKQLLKQGAVPSIIRKGAYDIGEKFSYFAEVPFKVTTGRGFNPAEREVSADIIGTSLLFAGVNVATPSTTQLQKALLTETKVGIIGITARGGEGVSQTGVKFVAQTGKVSKEGYGLAISKSAGDKAITYSKAGFQETSIKFPTGKIISKIVKPSEAVSFSVSKKIGENVIQLSLSGTKQGKSIGRELSIVNIKDINKELIGFKGKSISTTGDTALSGIIKRVSSKGDLLGEGATQSFLGRQTQKSIFSTGTESQQIKTLTEAIGKVTSRETEKAVSTILYKPKTILPSRTTSLPVQESKVESSLVLPSTTQTQKGFVGLKQDTSTTISSKGGVSSRFGQSSRTEQKQILKSEFDKSTQKEKLDEKQKQTSKTTQAVRNLFQTKEAQKLKQSFEQAYRQTYKITPKPKIKSPTIFIPRTSLAQRLAKKVEEDGFEAFGFRFGKEVKLGKGTKEESAKSLAQFLKGSLGASGFLQTKAGQKLKAEETGLLGDVSFRKSKVSQFKVVERKEKRLRRGVGQTGEQIQFFKGSTKKRRSGLF